jgi:hypothetical protein
MSHAVLGLAQSYEQTVRIVDDLKLVGFSKDEISLLYPDKGGLHDVGHDNSTKAPEGIALGAGTGGLIGGALGWLAGIGALTIPGIGPFIAAGPILAALSGIALGTTLGGVTGGLIGLGIPEYEAKIYADKLSGDNVLIAVHTHNKELLDRAEQVLKDNAATDINKVMLADRHKKAS